jgi:hypothetical protein
LIAVERYQSGEDIDDICASLGRSRAWLFKWASRSDPSDETWAQDRPRRPKTSPGALGREQEEMILAMRRLLVTEHRFCGPQAILWELEATGGTTVPSLSTVERIVLRHKDDPGLRPHPGVEAKSRYRPRGKRYPAPASGRANMLHQSDFVGPCYLTGGTRFYSLHVVDVATRRVAVEPVEGRDDETVLEALWRIWKRLGKPRCLQLDNEMTFFGSYRYPRATGQLIRLCLKEHIEPVFIPMGEPWRNSIVEKFNDTYEDKLLGAVTVKNVHHLGEASLIFEHKHNERFRYSALEGKTPNEAFATEYGRHARLRLPETVELPRLPLPRAKMGRYRLIRFIRSNRRLDIFGEGFLMPKKAVYEYVTATIDVKEHLLTVKLEEELIATIDYKVQP